MAFTVWVVGSYYWSIVRTLSISSTLTMVQPVVLLLVMWEFAPGAPRQTRLMIAYVCGSSLTCSALLWRHLQGHHVNRYTQAGTHPNDLAFTASLAIPLAWYVVECVTSRSARILMRLYVPVAVIGILLTASRSVLFTMAVGLFILPLSSARGSVGKQQIVILAVAGSILLAAALAPPQVLEGVSTTGHEFTEGDFRGRRQLWAGGSQVFAEHPLAGVGTGARGWRCRLTSHSSRECSTATCRSPRSWAASGSRCSSSWSSQSP